VQIDLSNKKPCEVIKYLQALIFARHQLHQRGFTVEILKRTEKNPKKIAK
jgi:hypothetical protein